MWHALPFHPCVDVAYHFYLVVPMCPAMMWVDDTIMILVHSDHWLIQGVLVDRSTYLQGVLRVAVPNRKLQHWSTVHPLPLRSLQQLGNIWGTPGYGYLGGQGIGPPSHGHGQLTPGSPRSPKEP